MRRKQTTHTVDGIFVLLLFALLAGSLLMVLLMGAGSYQRLAARDAASYERSTCLQYIVGKLRHGEQQDAISVETFPGNDVSTLSITQELDGSDYQTLIYVYEGKLCELFTATDTTLRPEDGNEVMPCAGLRFEEKNGLLAMHMQTADGEETTLRLALRTGGRNLG